MFVMLMGLFGGLAIFIFAMDEMGKGLQQVAGTRLKKILESLTSKPVLGVLVGAAVTGVIQSSSATTVMVVGFVNAGLMNLRQAIAVIMGSNIGTTITSQLITFNITKYYLAMIAIGFAMFFIIKKQSVKNVGKVIFAFGLLFMGLDFMGKAMEPLQHSPLFADFMAVFGQHAILSLLAGLALTTVIQSSSAAMGILLAMTGTGLVTLDMALPCILGFNIGTCITCVLASIGTKTNAKRAAAAHVTFNIIGAAIFFILLPIFKDIVLLISPDDNVAKCIANAHTLFNIATTIILLPFIGLLEKFVTKVLPEKEMITSANAIYLDHRALHDSNIALSLAIRETVRMGELARENIQVAYNFLIDRNPKPIPALFEREDTVDALEHDIAEYLIKIKQEGLTAHSAKIRADLYHMINDFERISDHSINVQEGAQECIEKDLYFSDTAKAELAHIYEILDSNISATIDALRDNNVEKCEQVLIDEDIIDALEESYRNSHISRLEDGACAPAVGVVFLDVISNFERVGDHCNNIAVRIKEDF